MEMELTADVSITLTGGEVARQSIPFMGLVIFSWSFAFKVTFRLLGLWIPHVEATILDLIMFKGGKKYFIHFICWWNGDGEVTFDVPITLTGGEGARQTFPFMGLVIFSWSIAFNVTFRWLGLWIPHMEATILDLVMFNVGKKILHSFPLLVKWRWNSLRTCPSLWRAGRGLVNLFLSWA